MTVNETENKTTENTELSMPLTIALNDFKLPIDYINDPIVVKPEIMSDLEFTHLKSTDDTSKPMCEYIYNTTTPIGKHISKQFTTKYTTDTNFLKATQSLIKNYTAIPDQYTNYSQNYKNIIDLIHDLRCYAGFKEKYQYVEWDMFDFLNKNPLFLQFTSIYNLISPLITFLMPIIILIVPFAIIRLKGVALTIEEYINVLKTIASQNAIGKLFVINFNEIEFSERAYIIMSAFFYGFSIYQNFMVCYKFNENMKLIHETFNELRVYLGYTLKTMQHYSNCVSANVTYCAYTLFHETLEHHYKFLNSVLSKIESITTYSMFNFRKINELGHVLAYFYELHTDPKFGESIFYSIGFNGYIECLNGLQQNISEGKLNAVSFLEHQDREKLEKDTSNNTIIKGGYYAPLKDGTPVKNDVVLNKNYIITGPNASGKTTILKSTLLNLIISQQIGYGFYDTGTIIQPYDEFHCYLNIPDTSGRDSLFQAEARRCKQIIQRIKQHNNKRHFCLLDELYSGTNPDEAQLSALSFIKYLNQTHNVQYMLTTHFVKVCKKLKKTVPETLYKMNVLTNNGVDKLTFSYKMKSGISSVKGGLQVLKQMDYPQEILDGFMTAEL